MVLGSQNIQDSPQAQQFQFISTSDKMSPKQCMIADCVKICFTHDKSRIMAEVCFSKQLLRNTVKIDECRWRGGVNLLHDSR